MLFSENKMMEIAVFLDSVCNYQNAKINVRKYICLVLSWQYLQTLLPVVIDASSVDGCFL